MRLFVALDIDEGIRQRLARFVEGVRGFAPEARWLNPQSLHVTLKFIGEWPDDDVRQVHDSLSKIRSEAVEVQFRGYGFFPTERAARVFWVGILGGVPLPKLAAEVDHVLSGIGIEKEQRAFSPHLTLARGAGGSGSPAWRTTDRDNVNFRRLQRKLAGMPAVEFGTMTAREFFLYRSELSSKGSRYTKIGQFALTDVASGHANEPS